MISRMRFDLFICFMITLLIYGGLFNVGKELGAGDWIASVASKFLEHQVNDVPDGEVGGYATEDTPRVQSKEEIQHLAEKDKVFTVEASAVRYYNRGIFRYDNYEWRILKLDDGSHFAIKLNTHKIIDGQNKNILPVGKLVLSEPGALEEMKEAMADADGTFITNAYIDMDGEAKTSYIGFSMKLFEVITWVMMRLVPLVFFVIFVFTIFGIHRIFVKLNIFLRVKSSLIKNTLQRVLGLAFFK